MNEKNSIDDKVTEEIKLRLNLIKLEIRITHDIKDAYRFNENANKKLVIHYAHEAEIKLLKALEIINDIKKIDSDYDSELQKKEIREMQQTLHLITNESYIN